MGPVGLPPLIQKAGLNPDFVFAGVVLLQGLTAFQALRSVGDANVDASRSRLNAVDEADLDANRKLSPSDSAIDPRKRTQFVKPPSFWTKLIQFQGSKVYQRDDLINSQRLDPQGRTSLQRMKQGLAPIGADGKPVELHHMLQTNSSPIAEVLRAFHVVRRYNSH